MTDAELTPFQKELMDAAESVYIYRYEVLEAIEIDNQKRKIAMRKELVKQEAKFKALVMRAVDAHCIDWNSVEERISDK